MEPDQAKQIIRSLADGRDPATGLQFPPDSPYQQADTVRALFLALEALKSGGSSARRSLGEGGSRAPRVIDPNKPKAGGAWSPEEEQQLRDEFAAHKPFPEMAAAHGRTAGAITARLVKLGLIEDNHAHRAGQGNRPNRPTGPIRPISSTPTSPLPGTHEVPPDCPF